MIFIGQTESGTPFALSHVADRLAGTRLRSRDELWVLPMTPAAMADDSLPLGGSAPLIRRFSQLNGGLTVRGSGNRAWLVSDGETIASMDFTQLSAFPQGVSQPDWAKADSGLLLKNEVPTGNMPSQ